MASTLVGYYEEKEYITGGCYEESDYTGSYSDGHDEYLRFFKK